MGLASSARKTLGSDTQKNRTFFCVANSRPERLKNERNRPPASAFATEIKSGPNPSSIRRSTRNQNSSSPLTPMLLQCVARFCYVVLAAALARGVNEHREQQRRQLKLFLNVTHSRASGGTRPKKFFIIARLELSTERRASCGGPRVLDRIRSWGSARSGSRYPSIRNRTRGRARAASTSCVVAFCY